MDYIARAIAFATMAHQGQTRRYTFEPYITHPARVSILVAKYMPTAPETIAAAWLHDVLEDTKFTLDDIEQFFSAYTCFLVDWLTDKATGNRQERKRAAKEKLKYAPSDAKSIKLADIIDNVPSIVEHDPEFAKVYVAEKKELLTVLGEGNEQLFNYASKTIWQAGHDLELLNFKAKAV